MKSKVYTASHARKGTQGQLPPIEVFPNQYPPKRGKFKPYEIKIEMPEFTSICPRTGLPDFGTLTLRYIPNELVAELKALKFYINAFRNMGIFQENVVNRVLRDLVKAAKPLFCEVVGEFTPRGGLKTRIVARFGDEFSYTGNAKLSSNGAQK